MAVNRPDVIREVNVGTGNNHGHKTKEDGICEEVLRLANSQLVSGGLNASRNAFRNHRGRDALKMNFSVGVSIYSANVTSY